MPDPISWSHVSRFTEGWDPPPADYPAFHSDPQERAALGQQKEAEARRARAQKNWQMLGRLLDHGQPRPNAEPLIDKIERRRDRLNELANPAVSMPVDPALAELRAEWRFFDRQHQESVRRAPFNTPLHYETGWLDERSALFRNISSFLTNSVRSNPYKAPQAEATRVQRAIADLADLTQQRDRLSAADPQRQVLQRRMDAMQLVIDEQGLPLISGRTAPPESGPFVVTRIKVIRHPTLWQEYEQRRELIRQALQANATMPNRADLGQALHGIQWGYRDANLPVIDAQAGEVYLVHGTSDAFAQLIAQGNFRPDFGAKKPESTYTQPQFGALGQGTYFSDSLAKAMTYTKCPECWNFRCGCAADRFVILPRVVLGRPSTARTHDSHRGESVDDVKPYRHSVYGLGRGHFYTRSLFGSNEFLIKEGAQAYPEFVVYWRWSDRWQ